MRHFITIIALLLCGSPATALERKDLRLHVNFDNTLDPQVKAGTVKVTVSKGKRSDIGFTYGRRGRAVLLKTGQSLNYAGRKLFADTEGTIAFWVRPIGWQAEDGKYHWFVNLFSPTTSHLFYKYGAGSQVILYVTGRGRTPTTLGQNHTWDKFARHKWTHLALSFKQGQQVYYIDGVPMQKQVNAALLIEPKFDGQSANINLTEGHPGNAIDDLMTFRRALSDKEVRALFGTILQHPVVAAPQMTPPQVDGRSSPGEWQRASSFVGWLDRSLGVAAANNTQVSVGHHNQHLFVRFRRPIPAIYRQQPDLFVGSPLKMTAQRRDASLAADDHVQVELTSRQGKMYSFAVNGDGVKRDAENDNLAWNGKWTVNQRWDAHNWIVEMDIALSDLDKTTRGWKINFADVHRQISVFDAVWSHQQDGRLELRSDTSQVTVNNGANLASGQAQVTGTIRSTSKAEYGIAVLPASIPENTSRTPKSKPLAKKLPTQSTAQTLTNLLFTRTSHVPEFATLVVRVGKADHPRYRWQAPFVYAPPSRKSRPTTCPRSDDCGPLSTLDPKRTSPTLNASMSP